MHPDAVALIKSTVKLSWVSVAGSDVVRGNPDARFDNLFQWAKVTEPAIFDALEEMFAVCRAPWVKHEPH